MSGQGSLVLLHPSSGLGAVPRHRGVSCPTWLETAAAGTFQGFTTSCLPSSSSVLSISLCGLISSDPCQDVASTDSFSDGTDTQVGRAQPTLLTYAKHRPQTAVPCTGTMHL